MAVITVKIPDKELDLFLQFLQKFKYSPTVINDEIPVDLQEMVLLRKKTAKAKDYISAKESNALLKKKYGL